MTATLKPLSPASRQAKQEQAQAAALDEIASEASRRREQTQKLRAMRLENEKQEGARFKSWRESQSRQGK